MQILKSDNLLSTLYHIQLPANGKTLLFADFDGTFMPFSHDDICTDKSRFPREEFSRYFSMFSDFLKANENKLELIITTGRNMPKFASFLEHIRENGEHLPLPKTVIINNGGDIYQSMSPESFFKGGSLGYTNANPAAQQKRLAIKKQTGWEGTIVKNKICDVLSAHNFHIIEVPINECSDSYGDKTLKAHLAKYGLDHQSSNFASIQDDGYLGFHIAFCTDLNYSPVTLSNLCNDFLNNFGREISYSNHTKLYDWQCGYGPSIRILPCIDGEPLNKVYDIQNALKTIIKNNSDDLIIVSGDDENDQTMLSPESYSDICKGKKPIIGLQILR